MRFSRIPALLALGALSLAACKKESTEAAEGNPLLAYVPADTPYLAANLESTPAEVTDAFLARMAPTLEQAQKALDDFEVEVHADDPGEYREARLLGAILAELDGKLSREGIESLGLSLEAYQAVYGMGLFPVLRVTLKDAAALRAAIGRIEAASGVEFEEHESAGTGYWKITGGDGAVGIYAAILEDHLAVSLFPAAAEAEWLPALLGQAMPASSLADTGALAQLNRDKGYTGFGSGYLDLRAIANEFLDADSATATLLADLGHHGAGSLSQACRDEIARMVAKAPRITYGLTELTAGAVSLAYTVELESGLAARLAELVADVPVADTSPNKVFAAALGLNVGRVRDFLVERATAITEAPFQCEQLQALNQQARQALDQLSQPMPPFVNNLKGFRVSLDEVNFENPSPEGTRGLLSLEVEKPQMLVGMAQMFVPGLDGLELEPGADPVAVPQELLSFTSGDLQIYAVMNNRSLGFAVGGAGKDELAAFMEAGADNRDTFFSVEYDMSAPAALQRRLGGALAAAPDAGAAYPQWLGRSRLEMGFDDEGLQARTRMTFRD